MNAVPFNFQKPGRLLGPLDAQFNGWLRTACALSTKRWHKELSGDLEVKSAGAELMSAGDALAALADDMAGYRLALQGSWTTLMAWPRPLALGLIGALLGQQDAELPPDRDLSPVEDSLFEFFLRDLLLPAFLETWTGRQPIRPEIGVKEGLPRWSRVFAADEKLVVATLLIKGSFGEHPWRWLLPRRGVLANFQDGAGLEQPAADSKDCLESAVRELPLEIIVTLGSVQLDLTQLANLRVGDLILLDQRVSQPLTAQLAGLEKMRGWPGRLGNRQAFQIEHWQK